MFKSIWGLLGIVTVELISSLALFRSYRCELPEPVRSSLPSWRPSAAIIIVAFSYVKFALANLTYSLEQAAGIGYRQTGRVTPYPAQRGVIAAHQNKNRQFPHVDSVNAFGTAYYSSVRRQKVQRAISAAGLQPVAP
jgi:hypothetical protein